jgi:hypothetical protein
MSQKENDNGIISNITTRQELEWQWNTKQVNVLKFTQNIETMRIRIEAAIE